MSINRVQKLLFSEYCDFEDMVLIESPFAQTTKDGKGIRQVHMGLTPSKLILATDVLPPVEYVNVKYSPGVDPEIETFELIAIYPVECVNLSIYKRRKTQALKARFCNNKVLYFELGGFEKRAMFWNLWCERVKFLCPGDSGSSRSETSVATSTTGSTLYLLDKKLVAVNGIKQLWCKFGPNSVFDNKRLNVSKWTDRHLYLGKNFDVSKDYKPVAAPSDISDLIKPLSNSNKIIVKMHRPETLTYMEMNNANFGDTVQINRFGSGIDEGCNTALYLTVDDYTIPRRLSQIINETNSTSTTTSSMVNMEHLAESAVLTWEFYKGTDPNKYKIRHKRRYGLTTEPFLFYGFGHRSIPAGSRYSLQCKKVVSDTNLVTESEEVPALSKEYLITSPSQQFISTEARLRINTIVNTPTTPVIFFWTPKYKYRPKSARDLFKERQKFLKKINDYIEFVAKRKKKKGNGRRCFKRKSTSSQKKCNESDEELSDEPFCKKVRKKKHNFIYNMFSSRIDEFTELETSRRPKESDIQCLKRMLKVDLNLTAWDFDSTTLAEQLTIIDKDLFLKIPTVELEILLWRQTARSAPNISAVLAFSQRISCLIATEILKNESERSRARLLARFINVAQKCHKMSNFQSCKTILCGLQCPAIYRLRYTWAYIRKKHASKYQNFEILCRFYRDPRLLTYQRTFSVVSQNGTFLPSIGDIIAKLLDKIPEYKFHHFRRALSTPSSETVASNKSQSMTLERMRKSPNFFMKLLNVFKTPDVPTIAETPEKSRRIRRKRSQCGKALRLRGLYEYYKPFGYYEDCRMKNLEETMDFLEKCQLGAMNFNFSGNELAKSYLLKSRYEDDKENFYRSLRLESPINFYEYKNIK